MGDNPEHCSIRRASGVSSRGLYRLAILTVVLVGMMLFLAGVHDAEAGVMPDEGTVLITVSPAVPSQISVDGIPRDTWALDSLDLAAGFHEISFSGVPGHVQPDPQIIEVQPLGVTEAQGVFLQLASLRVTTSPPVNAQITVNGVAMDQWGLWADVAPGTTEICFGPVAGFSAPACQTHMLSVVGTTVVTGQYVADPTKDGLGGVGRLRVTTEPPVPTQISINGVARATTGISWLELAPGTYEVSFADVPGFDTPAPETVTVVGDETTALVGDFIQRNWLRVLTDPPTNTTVLVDGVQRNVWGMWTDLPAANYEVCFEPVQGYETPPCQVADLVSGSTTLTTTVVEETVAAPPVILGITPSEGPKEGGTTLVLNVTGVAPGASPIVIIDSISVPVSGCLTTSNWSFSSCAMVTPGSSVPGEVTVQIEVDGQLSNTAIFAYT